MFLANWMPIRNHTHSMNTLLYKVVSILTKWIVRTECATFWRGRQQCCALSTIRLSMVALRRKTVNVYMQLAGHPDCWVTLNNYHGKSEFNCTSIRFLVCSVSAKDTSPHLGKVKPSTWHRSPNIIEVCTMGLANQLGQFMYGNISLDNNSQLANVKKVDVRPGYRSPIYGNEWSLP